MSAPPAGRGGAGALAAALAAVALFFSPALLGGGQFLAGDTGRMHHPVKHWIAAELRRGQLPEWNPYAGLGMPVLAGGVDAVLHPFNLLLVALPFETAFRLWVVLSYALAAVGAFLWARRLGAGPPAAAAGALAFALTGHLVSSSDNLTFLTGLAAMPLFLAAAHAAVERATPGRLALVAGAAFLAASAGDPQSFVLVAAALPAYAAWVVADHRPAWRRAVTGAATAAVAILASAPVLLPIILWVPHSSRAAPLLPVELARWNLLPLRLAELVVPGLLAGDPGAPFSAPYMAFSGDPISVRPWVASIHVGATVLALAGLGAARWRSGRALAAASTLALWMALGPHAGFSQLAFHLPLLSRLRYGEKLVALAALALAGAAALGVEALRREPRRWKFPAAAAAGGGALLAGALLLAAWPEAAAARLAATAPGPALEAARSVVVAARDGLLVAGVMLLALAGATLLVARGRAGRLGGPLLAATVAAELFASSSGAWHLSPEALAAEPAPLGETLAAAPGLQRVVTPDFETAEGAETRPGLTHVEAIFRWFTRSLHPAMNVRWRVGNLRTYAGLVPERAHAYERSMPLDQLLAHAGLFGVAHGVVALSPDSAARLGLPSPWAVEASDPALPAYALALPHRPRAYLAGPLAQVDAAGALAFARTAAPDTAGSVLEERLPPGYAPPTGETRIVAEEPTRIELATGADGPALLVLNDQFAPGWTAEVDGRPAEILAANFLARGVWVEAGRHRVVFRYTTPGLAAGLVLALAAVGALAAWALAGRRRRLHEVARVDTSCM